MPKCILTRIQATSPRQLLNRKERSESILHGAAAAFARSGFADTSMEDVAAATGVTRLIVYRHFSSKEDLYRAVLERVSTRLTEEFVAGIERHERRGIGALSLLTVAREDPNAFVLLWRHAAREPQFAEYAAAQRAASVAAARAFVMSDLGDETLVSWASEAFVGWLVEAVLAWLDHGDPARDDEFLDLCLRGGRALHAAWLTRPPELA
jgi:AcrR family transcriptional regulator